MKNRILIRILLGFIGAAAILTRTLIGIFCAAILAAFLVYSFQKKK